MLCFYTVIPINSQWVNVNILSIRINTCSRLQAQSRVPDVPSEPILSKRVVVLPKCVSGSVTGLGHALAKLIIKLSISDLSGVIFHWLSQWTVKLHHARLMNPWKSTDRLEGLSCLKNNYFWWHVACYFFFLLYLYGRTSIVLWWKAAQKAINYLINIMLKITNSWVLSLSAQFSVLFIFFFFGLLDSDSWR